MDAPARVYLLGTDGDPQELGQQRTRFAEAGAIVAPTAARAALAAAAIVRRDPSIVETALS